MFCRLNCLETSPQNQDARRYDPAGRDRSTAEAVCTATLVAVPERSELDSSLAEESRGTRGLQAASVLRAERSADIPSAVRRHTMRPCGRNHQPGTY